MDMNDDRLQFGEDGAPKMNDSYFENLYDDLPKEIADLLKSSHPFMESAGEEETLEEKRARRAAMRKEGKTTRKDTKRDSARASFHFDEPVKEEPVKEEAPVEEPAVIAEEPVAPKAAEEPKLTNASMLGARCHRLLNPLMKNF